MFLIRVSLEFMESIRLSHGAGGLHNFLPFHIVSALADSHLGALDPLLYQLPRKFWNFSCVGQAFLQASKTYPSGRSAVSPGLAKPSDPLTVNSLLQLWILCSSSPTVILLPQEQPPNAPHLSSGHLETLSQSSVFRPFLLSWPGTPLEKVCQFMEGVELLNRVEIGISRAVCCFLPDQGFLLFLS